MDEAARISIHRRWQGVSLAGIKRQSRRFWLNMGMVWTCIACVFKNNCLDLNEFVLSYGREALSRRHYTQQKPLPKELRNEGTLGVLTRSHVAQSTRGCSSAS